MSKMELLDRAKSEKWKICVYGLGTYGKTCSKEFLSYLEVLPDYYCDKNSNALKNFLVEDDKKIDVEKLKSFEKDILVFLFLSSKYENIVYKELEVNKKLHVINWADIHSLLNQDQILKKYFHIADFINIHNKKEKNIQNISKEKNKRIAIYTCITNNYDTLNKPMVIEDNCDYFLITDLPEDVKIENDEYYKRIPIANVVPKHISSPKDQNRFCKSHGYCIFPQYEYSIYLDGCLQIINPISNFIDRVGAMGIALYKHPFTNDAYVEAFSLSVRARIDKEEAQTTMQKFAEEGFERNYGMAECGVIVCKHDNCLAQMILNNWYNNYENNLIKRDQIYFAYTLWKMGISIDKVCKLPGNIRTSGYFSIVASHSGK